MIPKGVFSPYPPANGCPPGRVWHDTQCPAAARVAPLAMDSAGKLAGVGGAMGAIAGRHAEKKKPTSPRTAAAIIRSRCAEPLHPPSNGFGLAEAATIPETKTESLRYQRSLLAPSGPLEKR